MTGEGVCVNCGDVLEQFVIRNVAGQVSYLDAGPCPRPACRPDPTPGELRRAAEDMWLARQWALVHEVLRA
jgi:hypothetical protein